MHMQFHVSVCLGLGHENTSSRCCTIPGGSFQKLGAPFWGSPCRGLQYFGGCILAATVYGQRSGVTSHELQSKLFKGGLYRGLYMGTTIGDIKGDTRSLDYSSHGVLLIVCLN